jgi:hypothetical protein
MKRFQVWRYECDYCGKRSLSGGHMKAHEKGCTANPERVCRFHLRLCDEPQKPISELRAVLHGSGDFGMPELRSLANNCPICMLAAIRQSGICKWNGDPESAPLDVGFDFKRELEAAWKTINEAEHQSDYQYY